MQPFLNKTILVTGCAGFIGSHIVHHLITNTVANVIGIDNLSNGYIDNISTVLNNKRFRFVQDDITNVTVINELVKQCQFVIHLAALGSVPRSIAMPLNTHHANLTGFLNILDAARTHKIQRFVFASSSSVYGNDTSDIKNEERTGELLSPYAVTKFADELYAKVFGLQYGLEIIGLRYFNVFGPNQSPNGAYAAVVPLFINGLLTQNDVFINGNGMQSRDFTFVDNVVQANINACLAPKNATQNIYNIACGSSYSVNYLFEYIAKILQTKQKPIYRTERKGDILNSRANISKAKTLLQYLPEIGFEEGLLKTIDYAKRWHLER